MVLHVQLSTSCGLGCFRNKTEYFLCTSIRISGLMTAQVVDPYTKIFTDRTNKIVGWTWARSDKQTKRSWSRVVFITPWTSLPLDLVWLNCFSSRKNCCKSYEQERHSLAWTVFKKQIYLLRFEWDTTPASFVWNKGLILSLAIFHLQYPLSYRK